jgi:DNA-binding response OmpR family regulator
MVLGKGMIESLNDKSLLLLEDSEEFIENVISLLEMFISKVYIAKNISKAHEILKQNSVDIIFSDIHLKNENGLDFIEQLRKKDTTTPIVVLSGYKDEALLFRAMTLGLSGYLVKPINFKSLVDVFRECEKKIRLQNLVNVSLKDGFVYNKELKTVHKDTEVFTLNKKEILFFDMLIENKTRVITKAMVASMVYEDESMTESALNNFIMRIRRRFGKNFLHTIPDVGYKLIV